MRQANDQIDPFHVNHLTRTNLDVSSISIPNSHIPRSLFVSPGSARDTFMPILNSPCASIHKFPANILSNIFQIAFRHEEYEEKITLGLHVSWVCRRWRIIALACPSLWTMISFESGYPFTQAQIYLARSKKELLDINFVNVERLYSKGGKLFDSDDDSMEEQSLAVEKALSLIMPHADRWESFDCSSTFYHMEVILNTLLECPGAANLKELLIDQKQPYERSSYPGFFDSALTRNSVLFHGNLPKLELVSIEEIALYWDSPVLAHATHLTLTYGGKIDPRFERIMQILGAASKLTSLTIKGNLFKGRMNMKPTTLESLTCLTLDSIDVEEMISLMKSLCMPRLERLQLGDLWDKTNYSSLIQSLCDPHPIEGTSILGRIEQLRLVDAICDPSSMMRAYNVMSRLCWLHLEFSEVSRAQSFAQILADPSALTSFPPCPQLESVSFVGVPLEDVQRLVQHRIDIHEPLESVTINPDFPIVEISDEEKAWFNERLDRVEFGENPKFERERQGLIPVIGNRSPVCFYEWFTTDRHPPTSEPPRPVWYSRPVG